MEQRFLSLSDLNNMPQPTWLIEGMFEARSLVMLAGPSYSFKSFLLIDWLLCMASGRSWMGRSTVCCKVAYVLGEGKSSLIKRVAAWIKFNNLSSAERDKLEANFKVTFEVPQLASKASVDNMLADLDKENFKPDVIAIDTFARSFVGLDENDARDTGLWIESADRLRQLGYGVIFLHHTKKNTEFGIQYRGSTAIIGAMDTAMTLTRDNLNCTLKVTKQKDHDEGPDLQFRRVVVPISREKGDESCVLVPVGPVIDSRFSEPPPANDPTEINNVIDVLLAETAYQSDADRAAVLADEFKLSVEAAKMRILRRRKTITNPQMEIKSDGTS